MFALAIGACIVPATVDSASSQDTSPLDTTPYVATLPPPAFFNFLIHTGTSIGRGFIADDFMFTATHVWDDEWDTANGLHDVVNLGPSPISGPDILFDDLLPGTVLYYWTYDRKLMTLIIQLLEDDEYYVDSFKQIIPGDSGSPVFTRDGDVVGLVSRLVNFQDGTFGGIVERIVPEDLILPEPPKRKCE